MYRFFIFSNYLLNSKFVCFRIAGNLNIQVTVSCYKPLLCSVNGTRRVGGANLPYKQACPTGGLEDHIYGLPKTTAAVSPHVGQAWYIV